MIIATCPIDNFNSETGQCTQVLFVKQEGLLPALSVSDASLIASAIIACWAIGFGFKLIRKHLFR